MKIICHAYDETLEFEGEAPDIYRRAASIMRPHLSKYKNPYRHIVVPREVLEILMAYVSLRDAKYTLLDRISKNLALIDNYKDGAAILGIPVPPEKQSSIDTMMGENDKSGAEIEDINRKMSELFEESDTLVKYRFVGPRDEP